MPLDAAGAASLAEALKFNTSLASLELQCNEIGAADLNLIEQTAAVNRAVRDSLMPASIGLERQAASTPQN